jgi:hypothetical protein
MIAGMHSIYGFLAQQKTFPIFILVPKLGLGSPLPAKLCLALPPPPAKLWFHWGSQAQLGNQ